MPDLERYEPVDGNAARQAFVDIAAIHADEAPPAPEALKANLGEAVEAYKEPRVQAAFWSSLE